MLATAALAWSPTNPKLVAVSDNAGAIARPAPGHGQR
jgi:hypothetical protein